MTKILTIISLLILISCGTHTKTKNVSSSDKAHKVFLLDSKIAQVNSMIFAIEAEINGYVHIPSPNREALISGAKFRLSAYKDEKSNLELQKLALLAPKL